MVRIDKTFSIRAPASRDRDPFPSRDPALVEVGDVVSVGVDLFGGAEPLIGAVAESEGDRRDDGGDERSDEDADPDVLVAFVADPVFERNR